MEKAVDHAVLLRREVTSRSIAQIIQTLEREGLVEPGVLKRSTLQGKLAERGYSARQMRLYHLYPTLEAGSVEKSLRQAIQEYGVPDAFYFDNGKQCRTKWMNRMCSKLGIRLLYARPYSPESKGKVERFNRTVDSFLAEVVLEKPKSLEALNWLFAVWLEECYQKKAHSELPEKRRPFEAYQRDRRALSFAAEEAITDAFLHAETRKVDRSGCISFQNE